MSGGKWDYGQWKCVSFLEEFSEDKEVLERFPDLALITKNLVYAMDFMFKEIDYDLSGDSSIPRDKAFSNLIRELLLSAIDLNLNTNDLIEKYDAQILDLNKRRKDHMSMYESLTDTDRKDDRLGEWHKAHECEVEIMNLERAIEILVGIGDSREGVTNDIADS